MVRARKNTTRMVGPNCSSGEALYVVMQTYTMSSSLVLSFCCDLDIWDPDPLPCWPPSWSRCGPRSLGTGHVPTAVRPRSRCFERPAGAPVRDSSALNPSVSRLLLVLGGFPSTFHSHAVLKSLAF